MKICRQCQRSYPNSFAVCPRDGSPLSGQDEWSEGTVIRGKYRILEKLGQGAMGAVYKAMHVRFKELRAIKVMAPELATDKTFLKRFEHEAILARKLQHPNAVHVEDIDETEEGQPFIVMEYIAGKSLANVLRAEGALPVARVTPLVKQIASALNEAHRLSIVHRDIKPDNIVLIESSRGETAKVLDFGIAKMKEGLGGTSAGSTMSLTHTGMVVGTPYYMSPEQAKGVPGDQLDGRSDLYSLGIVMYQMLTGQLPLKGDTPVQILVAHIETPPPPIARVRPDLDIPEPITAVVMKCLAKSPQGRPQSGAKLIEELEAWESEKASLYSPNSIAEDNPPTSVEEQTQAYEAPEPAPDPTGPAATSLPGQEFTTPSVPPPPPRPPSGPAAPDSLFASRPAAPLWNATGPAQPVLSIGQPHRSSSKWTLVLVTSAVCIAIIGGAVWYSLDSPSPVKEKLQSTGASAGRPSSVRSGTAPRTSAQPSGSVQPSSPASDPQTQPQTDGASRLPPTSSTPTHTAKNTPKLSSQTQSAAATDTATRTKKINAALTLGDLFYEKGEYDNAVKEYSQGLQADPSHAELQARIQRALRAKAAEQSVNP